MSNSSFLFPGRLRSAFSHSRISPGSTRRNKTSRSAAADPSQILLVRGAPSERWGNCRTACFSTMMSAIVVSETSRHDALRAREEHPEGLKEPATVVARLSPKGDTRSAKRRQQAAGSEQGRLGNLAIGRLGRRHDSQQRRLPTTGRNGKDRRPAAFRNLLRKGAPLGQNRA